MIYLVEAYSVPLFILTRDSHIKGGAQTRWLTFRGSTFWRLRLLDWGMVDGSLVILVPEHPAASSARNSGFSTEENCKAPQFFQPFINWSGILFPRGRNTYARSYINSIQRTRKNFRFYPFRAVPSRASLLHACKLRYIGRGDEHIVKVCVVYYRCTIKGGWRDKEFFWRTYSERLLEEKNQCRDTDGEERRRSMLPFLMGNE